MSERQSRKKQDRKSKNRKNENSGHPIQDDARESIPAEPYLAEELSHLEQTFGTPARTYKDRVFRMLLKKKENSLEVYNAMNGTHYDNPGDLVITTLENAVYMGMKNDVSFIIYDQLMLYEHQSTNNPNMPLRDLFYVACVYARLTVREDMHSSRLIKIPEPKFVVFYNGTAKIPERSELKLSEAYESSPGDVSLELKVLVLNINPGCNQELLSKSPVLNGYMAFTDTVRKYEKTLSFPQAVETAVSECITKGILKDFLMENKAEVVEMSIFEYDEERHIRNEREIAMEDGIKIGEERGIRIGEERGVKIGEERGIRIGEERGVKIGEGRINKLIILLNEAGRTDDIIKAVSNPEYQEQLLGEFHL